MNDDPIHQDGEIRWKVMVGLEKGYWVAWA